MRLCVFLVALLAGCSSPKPEQVVPAADAGALVSVSKSINASDSKVAAAVTVAVENKDKPGVVEAEGRLALAHLPAPLLPDLEAARARAGKADPKQYAAETEFARSFLTKITSEWKQAQLDAKANAERLSLALNELNKIKGELAASRKETSDLKNELESARDAKWTIAGIALVAIGAILSAVLGGRVGGAVVACGALAGAMPSIYGSHYFGYIAGCTLALASALGLWRLWDYVKDMNAKTK